MASQIFLFYGEEDFLIQERIAELKKEISNPSLNIEQIDAETPDLEKLISALQTLSLLMKEKLLIIKNVDLRVPVWDNVVPALKMISSGTRVVFWASTVSKKSKLYQLIDEIGEVYEFNAFAEWEQDQVVSWIVRRVRALGKEISYQTAGMLQEICGNHLRKLASEIDKIITFIGDREKIEREDVLALASPGEMNIFALSNALAEKDLQESLSTFYILYKNKADLFHILPLLATQYRTMLQIKGFSGSSAYPQKIAQTLGVSPYFVRKCMEKAKNFSEEELKRNLELLLETDLRLKSGEQPISIFELLLTALCGK